MKKKLIAVGMSLLMVMGAGDKNLDQACYSSISYEETLNSVEWQNSHLRAWLNDASDDKSFLNVAFSKEEQEALYRVFYFIGKSSLLTIRFYLNTVNI